MADRALPPHDIAPHEFFTRWVPDSVARDADRQRRLHGTRAILMFELEGVEGAEGGVYTLSIAEGRVEGSAYVHAAPDLHVRLDVQTWRQLNAGEMSAPEAFLRRRVRLEGNLALAVKLHLIIG